MTRLGCTTALVVLALVGTFAPAAAADEPPVTVPTATVPTPQPDPAPRSQPKPQPAPKPRPAPRPRSSTPRPASPRPTYTPPAAPVRVTPAQHTRPAKRAKHAKKRHAAHKAKHARPAAKQPAATPQQRPQHRPTAVKGTRVAAHSASRNRDWLRWTLLLAVAAGLMGLSLALIGSSRRPARSSAARGFRLRRPRRDPIREVVAERVDRPAAELTAAAIAVPVPPLTLRAPAPEPKAQPEVTDTPVAPAPPPAPAAAPVASAEAAPVEPDVVPEPTEEICDIFVWRGYAKARFYARLDLDETDEFAVAESPVFRFRGNGMPDPTDAAKAAHRTLVEKLVAKGWEPEETSSGPWYAARFRRPLEPRH